MILEYIDFILKKNDKKYNLKLTKRNFSCIVEHFTFVEKNWIEFQPFFNFIIEEISKEKDTFNQEDNLGICYIDWDNNQFFISSHNDFHPYRHFHIPTLFFDKHQTGYYTLIQYFLNNWKRGNIINKIDCYYLERPSIFKDFDLFFDFKNEEEVLNFLENYRKIEKFPSEEFKNFNLSIDSKYVDIKDIEDFSMVRFDVDLKNWNLNILKDNDSAKKEIFKILNLNNF